MTGMWGTFGERSGDSCLLLLQESPATCASLDFKAKQAGTENFMFTYINFDLTIVLNWTFTYEEDRKGWLSSFAIVGSALA